MSQRSRRKTYAISLLLAPLALAGCSAGAHKSGVARAPAKVDVANLQPDNVTGGRDQTGRSGGQAVAAKLAAADSAVQIVKRGQVEVLVRSGRMRAAIDELTSLSARADGYIASSNVTASETPLGTVSVRVPVRAFEPILTAAGRLDQGTLQRTTSSGVDVTAQYVDLSARIQSLNAARDRYLVLLSRTSTIDEILSVQPRIDELQAQIDQLVGQRTLVDADSTFGTITVTIREPASPGAKGPKPAKTRTGFGKAWHDSTRRFSAGMQGVVAASGPLALVALFGLVALGVARLAYRALARQRSAQPG